MRSGGKVREEACRAAATEGRDGVAICDGMNESAWLDRQLPGSQRA